MRSPAGFLWNRQTESRPWGRAGTNTLAWRPCSTRIIGGWYTLARRLSNNADEARDLVQETFLRVATAASRVPHGSSHEEAWLVRVLVNLCRDRWRRSATRRSYAERHPPAVADTRNAETALVAQSVVWQALAQLPPRRRAIVVMHELEDRSPAEIARTLGVTAVTVRWHLSRGRRELAQIIRGAPGT